MQFTHKASEGLPSAALEALGGELTPYIASLRRVVERGGYGAPECSLSVPGDEFMVQAVEDVMAKVYSASLRYIFVIGIGGSYLGTQAIYDAMASARDIFPHDKARLIFIDTTDTNLVLVAKKIIAHATSPEELLFIVISKSGATTETLFNAEVLLAAFAERFGRMARRVVVLSETGSPLLREAEFQQMHTIALPPLVGGRYSVFTPVGLLPLGLLGFSLRDIKKSAQAMLERCLHPDIALNPAALSALAQYHCYLSGIRQHDTFVESPSLESLGKWYRQLLGESIGKPARQNPDVKIGITPTVSIISTDLHSVGQLYLGGPRDRLTTFVSLEASGEVSMPQVRAWPDLVPMLEGKSAKTIIDAITAGTKAAYNHNNLPFLSVTLPDISPESLAAFMQFKMCEVMMLGYLLQVNPFDQPQVEQYKTVTKQILSQK